MDLTRPQFLNGVAAASGAAVIGSACSAGSESSPSRTTVAGSATTGTAGSQSVVDLESLDWQPLANHVGSRLIRPHPPLAVCSTEGGSSQPCTAAVEALQNPFAIEDQPGAEAEGRAVWQPILDWLASQPDVYSQDLSFLVLPFNRLWDVNWWVENAPDKVVRDPRPGQPQAQYWWAGNQMEVSSYIRSYQSRWLPMALLSERDAPRMADALIAAAKQFHVGMHWNKGLAGEVPEAAARDRQTALNPVAFDAAGLILVASIQNGAFPGVPGHEPDGACSTSNGASTLPASSVSPTGSVPRRSRLSRGIVEDSDLGTQGPPGGLARRMIATGELAPEFELPSTDGTVRLSDFAGQWVVLYFYPADNTSGCTAEACSFRDAYEDFTDAGAVVIGASGDSVESHQGFAAKHRLPFLLVSDLDGSLRAAYGVRRSMGIEGRVTFVIDPSGVIVHTFNSQLRAKKHQAEALAAIRKG